MFRIRPARADEYGPAFRLVFHHLPHEERSARVSMARSLVDAGELAPEGILIAEEQGTVTGALVCIPLRGASGLVWPPGVAEGTEAHATEDKLVFEGLVWLRKQGAKLAQALVAPEEIALAAPLERAGFQHVTQLCYLGHTLADMVKVWPKESAPPTAATLRFEPYRSVDRDLFAQTLLRTYEGTLDCPELNGAREITEIIEGHQAQGEFDPDRWWLAREAGRPIGVLLLTKVFDWNVFDLSYLGVVPGKRGRGLGRQLAAKALRETQRAQAMRLTLAVDVRNTPARKLYADLGFQEFDHRDVYLYFF